MNFLIKCSKRYIKLNNNIGQLSSVLTALMALGTLIVVIMRYVWGIGLIGLQETVIYAFATTWWLCASLTLSGDGHVRVDIFYRKCSLGTRNVINICGHLLLLIPSCLILIWLSWPYVTTSWSLKEASTEPGGLALIYLLKSLLILGPGLLCLHAISLAVSLIDKHFSVSKRLTRTKM